MKPINLAGKFTNPSFATKKNYLSLLLGITLLSLTACGGSSSGPEIESSDLIGDPVALTLTINLKPEAQTTDRHALFEFVSDNASGFECSVNSAAYASCDSRYFITGLNIGNQNLSVRPIDGAGNTGDSQSVDWSIIDLFADDNPDLVVTNVSPSAVEEAGWRGIFRINCDFAHAAYNDPIVFPGQENAAHLHRFYGHNQADQNLTVETINTTGESTCQGNHLNLTSYWIPALLAPTFDSETNEIVRDGEGEIVWQYVPAVVGNDEEAHELFYYSAGIDDLSAIQPLPPGLKMIAGDMHTLPGETQSTSVVRWHCQSWESNDSTNPMFSATIPECVAPDRLRMDIFFPSCWNGVDLDSDDHKSHMAYPVNDGGPDGTRCPDSHPVPVVRASYHYAFGVKPEVYDPNTLSSKGWRLASDMYEVTEENPGGLSLHGDWFNGWHPSVMESILQNCIQQELDCHDGNLANGFRLSGTQEGTQEEAEIVNGGLGE